ncbi:hypothetical protein POM88_038530 [Heracleum sosnowskyi]|uniref:Uncharacterized protein n=1 Tax=Heracleum sosnowskyi TaxID=360622 RepID=A0AAD8HAU6_9APIA|nr:hypothetical protein POM88_038530 [Heracleum sosnowskyi]
MDETPYVVDEEEYGCSADEYGWSEDEYGSDKPRITYVIHDDGLVMSEPEPEPESESELYTTGKEGLLGVWMIYPSLDNESCPYRHAHIRDFSQRAIANYNLHTGHSYEFVELVHAYVTQGSRTDLVRVIFKATQHDHFGITSFRAKTYAPGRLLSNPNLDIMVVPLHSESSDPTDSGFEAPNSHVSSVTSFFSFHYNRHKNWVHGWSNYKSQVETETLPAACEKNGRSGNGGGIGNLEENEFVDSVDPPLAIRIAWKMVHLPPRSLRIPGHKKVVKLMIHQKKQKFASFCVLDARPGSVSRRLPDDLEKERLPSPEILLWAAQHSGSWFHDHDEGEDELVVQPKIKQK